jgi:glycosyltransferase involved in cell wall biosynthesis
MSVVIAHPGSQHAYRLAEALAANKTLCAYWSGVPVRNSVERWKDPWNLFGKRLRNVAIPFARRQHPVGFPVTNRLATRLKAGPNLLRALDSSLNERFDQWVSYKLQSTAAHVVVAYEGSALQTFVEAKRLGMTTVLDAASLHFDWNRTVGASDAYGLAGASAGDLHKFRELEIADFLIACSPLAAQSYQTAGYPRARIFVLPLGAEIDHGLVASVGAHERCRFVFLGALTSAKGVELLLDAFELFGLKTSASLSLIGRCGDAVLLKRINAMSGVEYLGAVSAEMVFQALREYDCLVMPSLRDGFGMVVPEAMSVGLPVIVSQSAGAACIVSDYPDAGKIVVASVESIGRAMVEVTNDRGWLLRGSVAARAAARAYSWSNYAQSARGIFLSIAQRRRQKENGLQTT